MVNSKLTSNSDLHHNDSAPIWLLGDIGPEAKRLLNRLLSFHAIHRPSLKELEEALHGRNSDPSLEWLSSADVATLEELLEELNSRMLGRNVQFIDTQKLWKKVFLLSKSTKKWKSFRKPDELPDEYNFGSSVENIAIKGLLSSSPAVPLPQATVASSHESLDDSVTVIFSDERTPLNSERSLRKERSHSDIEDDDNDTGLIFVEATETLLESSSTDPMARPVMRWKLAHKSLIGRCAMSAGSIGVGSSVTTASTITSVLETGAEDPGTCDLARDLSTEIELTPVIAGIEIAGALEHYLKQLLLNTNEHINEESVSDFIKVKISAEDGSDPCIECEMSNELSNESSSDLVSNSLFCFTAHFRRRWTDGPLEAVEFVRRWGNSLYVQNILQATFLSHSLVDKWEQDNSALLVS